MKTYRLLIADDEEHVRVFLSALLRGYEELKLEVVNDGQQAWDYMQAFEVDIVIADVRMPHLDGCDLVRRMKADAQLRLVPVILITGHTAEDASQVVFEAGADDLLVKPIVAANLQARLLAAKRLRDMHLELAERNRELGASVKLLEETQDLMVRSQKLEAMGVLASGIAHEINTPAQCASSNLRFLEDVFTDLEKLLSWLAEFDEARCTELERMIKEFDIQEIKDEVPKAIREAQAAVTRVAEIVGAMQSLSHPGDGSRCACDINRLISQAVNICRGACAEAECLQLELLDGLPTITVDASSIQQVLVNLIMNALHAVAGRGAEGRVIVRSRRLPRRVIIEVEDNGYGIDPTIQHRIFDPFFTTKSVGQGSGQGLAIANSIIERHGGRIEVESRLGAGSSFVVMLPIGNSNSMALTRPDFNIRKGQD